MRTTNASTAGEWLDLRAASELAGLSPRVILLAVVSEEIQVVDTHAAMPADWRLSRHEFEGWVRQAQRPDPEPALALAS